MQEIQVQGRKLTRALVDFEQACLTVIADEIYTFDPDETLVDLLAEAVRLAREYGDRYPQRKEA